MLVILKYVRELVYVILTGTFRPLSLLGVLQIVQIRLAGVFPSLRDRAGRSVTSREFFNNFLDWHGTHTIELSEPEKEALTRTITTIACGKYKDVSTTKRVFTDTGRIDANTSKVLKGIISKALMANGLDRAYDHDPKITIVAWRNLPSSGIETNLSRDALVPHRDLDYPFAIKFMFEFDEGFVLKNPETKYFGDRTPPYRHRAIDRGSNELCLDNAVSPIKNANGLMFDSFALHSGPSEILMKRYVLQLMVSIGSYNIRDLAYLD